MEMFQVAQQAHDRKSNLYNVLNNSRFSFSSLSSSRSDPKYQIQSINGRNSVRVMHSTFAETSTEREIRMKSLVKSGLCPYCGEIRTHKIRLFGTARRPLTNDFVLNGVCRSCEPPEPALQTRRTLIELTHVRDWQGIEYYCEKYPYDSTYLFKDKHQGNTALHYACIYNGPFRIIQALVERSPSLAQTRNNRGQLPLHCALFYKADILILVPLLRNFPDGVHIKDLSGKTPIDYISHKKIINFFRNTDHSCVRSKNEAINSKVLLEWAKFMMILRVNYGLENASEAFEKFKEPSFCFCNDAICSPQQCWNTCREIMNHSTNSKSSWKELHSVVGLDALSALDLFYFVLEFSREQVNQLDDQGRTPLHIVAGFKSRPFSLEVMLNLLVVDKSTTMIKDNFNNIPLIYALDKGRTWNTGVKMLVDSCPESLLVRDSRKLLPFMVSALPCNSSISTAYSADEAIERLECCFRMIKACPEACGHRSWCL